MNKYKFALFICAIVWGFGYVAMDNIVMLSSPFMAIGVRFTIASLVILLIKFRDIRLTFKQNIFEMILLGVVLFIAFAFQTYGLALSTTAKNAFLTATNVVWTPLLLGVFYKFKIKPQIIVGSVVMIIGIGFVSLDGLSPPNIGDLLTIFGAIFFAVHIILINRNTNNSNLGTVVFGQLFITGILGLLVASLTDQFVIDYNGQYLVSLLFAALLSTAFCFFFQNYGLAHVDGSSGAIILSLEALFGAVAAVLLSNESLSTMSIIGFIIMFCAIIISEKG